MPCGGSRRRWYSWRGFLPLICIGPGPQQQPVLGRLDSGVGHEIAVAAVKNLEAGAALEIVSSDPAEVQKKLAAQGMDFPVLMLKAAGASRRGRRDLRHRPCPCGLHPLDRQRHALHAL